MERQELRKLPIGIQNFESLRNDGYLYVDKTERIHSLITSGRYYFLSRPRRFGKSLLMSTIRAVFEGKRDLFEGLAIASKPDWDWQEHPVLHLDLNTQQYDSPEKLAYVLNSFLKRAEQENGVESDSSDNFGPRFESVIRRAYERTGRRVVILVDEYDKPLLQAIGNPELQNGFRAILKGFYGALKSMDGCIRFAMLTGVTKFGKVSVFSDLNNLRDISMLPQYYDICGINETEIHTCFEEEVRTLAARLHITDDEAYAVLKKRYDGYRFTAESTYYTDDNRELPIQGVYNPFSVLNALANSQTGSYWFETGTPTYLVNLLQRYDYNLEEMSRVEADADTLNSVDSESSNPIPVIYQSGYLTIRDYDPQFKTYTLGFPNEEVEEGFTKFLMPFYTCPRDRMSPFSIANFVRDVRDGRTEQFITRLRSLFADTPYELIRDLENHYRNVVWLLFKLMGFYTQAEYRTSQGRIDLVVGTPKYCYVMEFKLDGSAEEALAQIQDRGYTLPFAAGDRQIIRLGINFDKETRNIDRVLVG